jgi:hypothetical protein
VLSLPFLSTVQLRSIVDTIYIESIHERERDVGIVEFMHERVADVLRACCGRVALSGNINVSDVSREFHW